MKDLTIFTLSILTITISIVACCLIKQNDDLKFKMSALKYCGNDTICYRSILLDMDEYELCTAITESSKVNKVCSKYKTENK